MSDKAGTTPLPRAFHWLFAASSATALGDGLRMAALPLLASSATSDPRAIALVTAAGFLPWLLLGLIGGAVADRVDRRAAMMLIGLLRSVTVVAFAIIVAFFNTPPVATIALLAFLLGVAETVYDNAAISLLPKIVETDQLAQANARIFNAQTIGMQLVGPAVGGLLYALMPELPFALIGFAFLLGAVFIRGLPTSLHSAVTHTSSSLRKDVVEGLRFLAGDPVLRAMVAMTPLLGAVAGGLLAILVIFVQRQLGAGAVEYGALLGTVACGSLIGASATPKMLRRMRPGLLLTGAVVLSVLVFVSLALVTSVVLAGASLLALGLAMGCWSVASITVRQRLVPNELLGRVSSAYRASSLSLSALGAACAGIVTATAGFTATLLGSAGLLILGLALFLTRLNAVDLADLRQLPPRAANR